MLVHRSRIAADVTEFALQKLRDQIGQKVYLGHRLDRKTSGVLLFSKSAEVTKEIQKLFRERMVQKKYSAIVRGFVPSNGTIDYPLTVDEKTQEAKTSYQLEKHFEINVPHGKFLTSRYSLVSLYPETGRFHQLRKHMCHIFHPIIGDRPHGCNKQNRLWKEKFGVTSMMLHAMQLDFEYPAGNPVSINAVYQPEFVAVLNILNTQNILTDSAIA